jgi:hypothetical protein
VSGLFQDIAAVERFTGTERPTPPVFYTDVAVLAYRLPEEAGALPVPRLRASDGKELDAGVLSDGSFRTTVETHRGDDASPGHVIVEYAAPQTIRALSVGIPGMGRSLFDPPDVLPRLDVEEGQGAWRKVADLPLDGGAQTTVSFEAVTGRRFRVVFVPVKVPTTRDRVGSVEGAITDGYRPPAPPTKTIVLAELKLSGESRIDRFEVKAGFGLVSDYFRLADKAPPNAQGIAPASVIDLTSRMGPDGRLDWTPPPGRWKILRLGSSLTGTTNHPATPEATGLEVDKFDGEAVKRYLDTYIGMFRETTGPELIGERGLRALLTDSIEVGPSNWTRDMLGQFQKLRGYDPRPWLPTLTGVLVGSRTESDAFLYDFRRTLADLIVSEHYGQVAATAHRHGLKVYGEALEAGRPSLGDDMAMRSHADIPMAALWTYPAAKGPRVVLLADMKGAASVAHVYGQNLVAAESLTAGFSPWAFAPSNLKTVMDLEFAYGINRPVIHTSVHQPVDDKKPGLSLMIFGQYFNRHETWAEMAKPWVDYISRSSFMLQQGRYFADVAYFYGEEAPLTGLYKDTPVADAPIRYGFDFVNPDVVLNRLSVDGGDLTAPSGARYRVLYLGGSSHRMTLGMLQRLAALAEAGATIVGAAPMDSPALTDDPAEFARLVHRLWSGSPVTQVGRGRVIASKDIESALQSVGVAPDFSYEKPAADSEVLFLHRRLADGDAYFLSNRKDRAEHFEARLRVTGKRPEIWRADTGASEPVTYRVEDRHTVVALDMLPQDAFFIVFREPTTAQSATAPKAEWKTVYDLGGSWDVAFPPGLGAPAAMRLEALQSLSVSADPGVKYFSGSATYRKTFTLPRGVKRGAPLMLDLGSVGDVAEVRVNGQLVGTAWKAPYRIDIGQAVRPGRNELEIRVANLWVNRLIGDAQPGASKVTFTTLPTYKPDAPLRPSGLMGPVTLMTRD